MRDERSHSEGDAVDRVSALQTIVDKLPTWVRRIKSAESVLGCGSTRAIPARQEIRQVAEEMAASSPPQ